MKETPRIQIVIQAAIITACFLLLPISSGYSHSLGQSYLFLKIYDHSIQGSFEITFADANKALGLNGDDLITESNLSEKLPLLHSYYQERVSFSVEQAKWPVQFTGFDILRVKKLANYIIINFKIAKKFEQTPQAFDIDYAVLFDVDPQQQAFVVIEHYWKANLFNNERHFALVFGKENQRQTLDLTDYSIFSGLLGVIKMGIKHIWIGIDHILFLIALILPSVMVRRKEEWLPVEKFRPALIYVVKIITLFTVAHSVTLSVAALGIIELPSRLVESMIAISIAIAALDIVYPILHRKIGLVVFGFGLFHGFGFASVLTHLGVLGEHMALSLFGFNLGVELGQVVIIILVFPVLYLIRRQAFYRPVILKAGAVMLICIAMFWFVERAFEYQFPIAQLFN